MRTRRRLGRHPTVKAAKKAKAKPKAAVKKKAKKKTTQDLDDVAAGINSLYGAVALLHKDVKEILGHVRAVKAEDAEEETPLPSSPISDSEADLS